MTSAKPIVLHFGEDIKYSHDYYESIFTDPFTVVANEEPDRASFIAALKSKKYGDFSAIFRPHFQSGGEMGQWDDELIPCCRPRYASSPPPARGSTGPTSTPSAAGGYAVSDTALFLILSVFRNFWRSQRAARTGDSEQFTAMHSLVSSISRNPRGYVLGMMGLGNISKKLAYKARTALGMEIHYYYVVRSPKEVEEELEATFHPTLHDLLGVADCVTLHTPLNAHTQDSINKEASAAIKDGASLVNTSRGQVFNANALVEALQSGWLAAAGLDVHYHEPRISRVLADMDNVTLTCHNGGAALTTRLNFEVGAMRNIVEVVGANGEFVGELLTPVNRKA
ncbi:Glyoxylate reductase [Colletotrichum spinosum]|uniref:Glyoxylate reductase n=1 Tax=Colletotrichum spinosum TaxID=1347390 RepID=A0A4R8Q5B3_9PEZI|nr:Glyoxylate reductase [Colletotrichum spinosum]